MSNELPPRQGLGYTHNVRNIYGKLQPALIALIGNIAMAITEGTSSLESSPTVRPLNSHQIEVVGEASQRRLLEFAARILEELDHPTTIDTLDDGRIVMTVENRTT